MSDERDPRPRSLAVYRLKDDQAREWAARLDAAPHSVEELRARLKGTPDDPDEPVRRRQQNEREATALSTWITRRPMK